MSATTLDANDRERRHELAGFLRAAREAIPAGATGVALTARRRAKGLLREEVAAAAGISATWYMWLEQGRDIRVSPRALEGLSRARRLDGVQRAFLYRTARPDLLPQVKPIGSGGPGKATRALVRALAPNPVYVLDQRWDVVLWNAPAELLLGGFDRSDPWSANLIARMFTDVRWRELFADWEEVARSCAAQFRAMSPALAGDEEHQKLVAALRHTSPEFEALWVRRELADSPGWTKRIVHPEAGSLSFDYSTLRAEGEDSEYRLSIYTPSNRRSAEKWGVVAAARHGTP
jgi:transcriptional regulator with XRE-family HTH domain